VSDEDAASLSGSLLDAPAAELAPALGGYGLRRGEDLLGLIRIAPQVVELATRESAWTVEQEGGAWDFLARSHPGQEPVARFERQGAGGRFTIFATDADVALRRTGWLSSRWELEADDEGLLAAFLTRRKPDMMVEVAPAARAFPHAPGLLLFATWIVTALRHYDLVGTDVSGDALM